FVVEQPPMVKMSIESQPSGAQVLRASDNALLGTTPFSENVVKSDEVVRYVLKLTGYVDARVELPARADASRLVALLADPPPPGPAPAPVAPRVKPPRKTAKPKPPANDDNPVDPFH